MKLLRLVGNFFFALLDISMGAFVACNIGNLSGQKFDVCNLFIGSFLATVPDVDVVYMFIRKKKVYTNHHEFITHRPMIVIPATTIICWVIGGKIWGLIGVITITWHYLHDTDGLGGGGIAWLWPFSRKYFSPKGVTSPDKSVMNLEHNSVLAIQILRPSTKIITETLLSTFFLVYALSNTVNWATAIIVVALIWLCLITCWIAFFFQKRLT